MKVGCQYWQSAFFFIQYAEAKKQPQDTEINLIEIKHQKEVVVWLSLYPEFRFEPNITFTDEDVEAIRSMAVDGDENAESLLDLFEECKSRMDFEI